jgi:hypothetical protein
MIDNQTTNSLIATNTKSTVFLITLPWSEKDQKLEISNSVFKIKFRPNLFVVLLLLKARRMLKLHPFHSLRKELFNILKSNNIFFLTWLASFEF